MVKVSKEEVEVIRQKAPAAHIAIVNRQTSHKKYYVEESSAVKRILMEMRGITPEQEKKSKRQRHRKSSANHDE